VIFSDVPYCQGEIFIHGSLNPVESERNVASQVHTFCTHMSSSLASPSFNTIWLYSLKNIYVHFKLVGTWSKWNFQGNSCFYVKIQDSRSEWQILSMVKWG